MPHSTTSFLLSCLPLPSCCAVLSAQQSAPPPDPVSMHHAMSLTEDGLKPWHLKATFTLHSLDGRPSEQGTLEEWWAGPGRERIVVQSRSVAYTAPAEGDAQPDESPQSNKQGNDPRSRFLVGQLLDTIVSPVPDVPVARMSVTSLMYGKVKLSCLNAWTAHEPGPPSPLGDLPSGRYCSIPPSTVVRLIETPSNGEVQTLNKLAIYQHRNVPLLPTVSFGSPAIEGTVAMLEDWNESSSPQVLTAAHLPYTSGVVTAAKKLGGSTPLYPIDARDQRVSGAVVLGATINEQGRIARLFVIASPSVTFSESAMNAVETWTYTPALLNGTPTTLSTVIVVRFHIGPE